MNNNTIVILKTIGPEFRVAYVPHLYNLFEVFDDENKNFTPAKNLIREYFQHSPVFISLEEAKKFSNNLWKALLEGYYPDLEGGIYILDNWAHMQYHKLIQSDMN